MHKCKAKFRFIKFGLFIRKLLMNSQNSTDSNLLLLWQFQIISNSYMAMHFDVVIVVFYNFDVI